MLDRLTIERMAAKAGDTPILIALSGGGDSVALLHLLLTEFGAERLRAAVVDHALRQGSDDDARRAFSIAARADLAALIHTVDWGGQPKRAHEAAREARYRALADAAKSCGARVIVTGHTRDDQAETVLLRASRDSGVRGLAGMRALTPMPIWPQGRGLWLARPLLGVRRVVLRHYLQNFVDPFAAPFWIEDPANLNEAYARVRARKQLEVLEDDQGFDPMRLADLADQLAPHVEAIDRYALALIEASASFEDDEIVVSRSQWVGDAEVKRRALVALITAAGGHARGPSAEQVARLDGAIEQPDFEGFTLAGARVRERRGAIVFGRDPGAMSGRADGVPPIAPLELPADCETVWDARVALTVRESGWSVAADGDKPRLQRGEERLPLAAASPHWLLKERVQHVLGQH